MTDVDETSRPDPARGPAEKASFEEFARQEARTNRLLAIAHYVLRDWAEAEEVRNDTLIELHRRWEFIDHPQAYGAMTASRMAVHRSIQRAREKGLLDKLKRDATLHGESAEHDCVQHDTLRGILAGLSEREVHVMVMLYNGWNVTAVAAELHIREATVRKYRDRAIRKIKPVLGDFDIHPSITEAYGEPA